VTAIVRRRPLGTKVQSERIRSVCANMDVEGITKEVARIKDRLAAVGQNADESLKGLTDEFTKCEPTVSATKMGFKSWRLPGASWSTAIIGCVVEMEDNKLEPRAPTTLRWDQAILRIPLRRRRLAVGDKVDETVGLPYKNGLFVRIPIRQPTHPTMHSFRPMTKAPAAGGRSVPHRMGAQASEGLVGVAKRDGEWCAKW